MEKSSIVTFEFIQNGNTSMKLCADFLVIYGLKGKAAVTAGEKRYEMSQGGLLTIAPFTHYSLQESGDSNVAVLHIPQKMLQIIGINKRLTCFQCYIGDDSSGIYSEYDQIRMYYARILKAYFVGTEQSSIQLFTSVSQMLNILITYFSVAETDDYMQVKRDAKVVERYDRIMTYVHEHWREPLSIEQLAKQEYVSSGYLSRSFKEYTGKTFTEYLMELRLQNAAHDLRNHTDTITQIAYENGFRDANSFIKHFKVRYGITPKQYRKTAEKNDIAVLDNIQNKSDDGTDALLMYATLDEQAFKLPMFIRSRQIQSSVNAKGKRLRHTWKRLMNAGYARYCLLAEVQDQIRKAKQEIDFEYIRFHGIFDEDMHVYYEDEQGRPYLDFSRVDMLLDFVSSVGLKPYVEFGYIPKLLAKSSVKLFDRGSYVSAVNSEEKWRFLIDGFLHHCISRYGRDAVLSWKFTVHGCNCVTVGFVSMEDYLVFYRATYECVKGIDKRLAFGGPGGHSFSIWNSSCFRDFFEYAIAQNCVPDFVCTQCFPHHIIEQNTDFRNFDFSQVSSSSILSNEANYTRMMLADYRKLLDSYGLSHLDIWLEEWNSTCWQRDLSADTCYKAAWLAKNICENYDEAEAFGYWTLSDFIEEYSDFGSVYHGGYGLFTYNGIPKSGWLALQLLKMLGDTKLDSGEGWMITRSNRGIQIILTHYCHYDNLFRMQHPKLLDPRQAYDCFLKDGMLKYEVRLTDLPKARYEIKKYCISAEQGSSFDVWLRMGMPQYPRSQELAYLKQMSQPRYHVDTMELEGSYTLESCLSVHEVQIILLETDEQLDIG